MASTMRAFLFDPLEEEVPPDGWDD